MIVNPLLAEANLHGGIVQGIGGAMFEHIVYDEAGQLLTATFMDYTIPTAVEVPSFEVGAPGDAVAVHARSAPRVWASPGVTGPLGALCSAIENALPHLDLKLSTMPLTPDRVWQAMRRRDGTERRAGMISKEYAFEAPKQLERGAGLAREATATTPRCSPAA